MTLEGVPWRLSRETMYMLRFGGGCDNSELEVELGKACSVVVRQSQANHKMYKGLKQTQDLTSLRNLETSETGL